MAAADAVDSMYMDNLDEFINDENKIVTYRWLSTTLQVHVNQAKQMLYNFVMHQRNDKKDDNLNVTYFVAGLQKNEDSPKIHRCEVVSESNLEAVKSTLQKLYSCHIYSIQKSKLNESDALYITDYNLMKENVFDSCRQSSIQFNAKKLVAKLENVAPEIKREVITPSSLLNNDAHPKKLESKEKTTGVSRNHGGSGKSSKMGNIAGMFAKSSIKKESPKTDDQNQNSNAEAKPAVKKESTELKKQPSGMMSFFANSTAKTKPSEKKSSEEKPSIPKKESPVVSKKRTEQRKKPASSDSDDDFVQKKKRRRIKDDLFDSSSSEEEEMEMEDPLPSPAAAATPDSKDEKKDDEEEEEKDEKEKDEEEKEESVQEDESPIPDTPEQKKAKKEEPAATVRVTSDGRRRKHIKRKKKKTYLNDEGFMVTENVMESDSTDASDIEQPPTNKDSNPSKPSVQKKVGPAAAAAKAIADKGKQKQSSLMSFFQKK